MRFNEIISERDYSDPSEDMSLVGMLRDWSDGYNADDVWSGERMAFDKQIIAAAKGLAHRVDGMLYRGQGIMDETFDALAGGETVTTDATQTLLTSWTKSEKVAQNFAEVAHENHGYSSVVIAIPASRLKIVVDFDQVEGFGRNSEHEVLCMHEPLMLTPQDIRASYRYNGD